MKDPLRTHRAQRSLNQCISLSKKAIYLFTFYILNGCMVIPVGIIQIDHINNKNGIALAGYDVVAYHSNHAATKGNHLYSMQWMENEWLFSSKQNLALFEQNPEKYLPEYGGYCARAIALGYIRGVNPEIWHILDGKLLLFHSTNYKEIFLERISGGIVDIANEKWAIQI